MKFRSLAITTISNVIQTKHLLQSSLRNNQASFLFDIESIPNKVRQSVGISSNSWSLDGSCPIIVLVASFVGQNLNIFAIGHLVPFQIRMNYGIVSRGNSSLSGLLGNKEEVIFILSNGFLNQSAWVWISGWHEIIWLASIKFLVNPLVNDYIGNLLILNTYFFHSILDRGDFKGFAGFKLSRGNSISEYDKSSGIISRVFLEGL
jgi:hypothetical protein